MFRSFTLYSFVAVALLGLSFLATEPSDSSAQRPSPEKVTLSDKPMVRPDAEFHHGMYVACRTGVTDAVAYVWSYEENGMEFECWALYKPGTTNGWTFPSSSNTSVDVDIDYEDPSSTVGSLSEFAAWCVGEHPGASSSSDFEFHMHVVYVVTP